MSLTGSQLLLTLVVVWNLQFTVFTAAWPLASQEEEQDKEGALTDPDLFEGDILIGLAELERHYGRSHTDNVSIMTWAAHE